MRNRLNRVLALLAQLQSELPVTSCSHIFCDDCAKEAFVGGSTCPACSEKLPTKYDVVRIDLHPTEQYKSMILAGLKPDTIMEICSRALSFWTYQACQEKIHLDATVKALKEKRQLMEQHYVQLNNHAQTEFNNLKSQLAASKKELDSLKEQMNELADKLSEKSRQYQKLQSLYDALRRQCITVQQRRQNQLQLHLQEQENMTPRHVNQLEPFIRGEMCRQSSTNLLRPSSPHLMRTDRPTSSPSGPHLAQRTRPSSGECDPTAQAPTERGFRFGQFNLDEVNEANQLNAASPPFSAVHRLF